MKEYKIGDIITIRKDITLKNINELMIPYFGKDDYSYYYNKLQANDYFGEKFTITHKTLWDNRNAGVFNYELKWDLPDYICPSLFKESVSQRIILFEDD
jgi:hypothetical protein